MKGTIDVQIKRKDGTIEIRHEHNVVFDIPSLTFKKWSESPLAIATGTPTSNISLTADRFNEFCLSEDTISTVEPHVVPVAVRTVSSSTTKWYEGPTTVTTTSKSKSISATWTIGEALTLKSIFFSGNTSMTELFNKNTNYCLTSKDNIYDKGSDLRKLRRELLDSPDFLLSGVQYWNGLSSDASTMYEIAYVDYPLCNADERFVFSYLYNNNTTYATDPFGSPSTLEIRNKDTNTIIRSFSTTQFTDFDTTSNNKYRTYIVNTGTKNVLAQPTTDRKSLNLWQIPDIATTEAIPISATVLTNQCNYNSSTNTSFKVVGPYIAVQTQSGDYRNVVRINDDFSATTYHGWSGNNQWITYYSSSGDRYPIKYRSGGMLLSRTDQTNNYSYSPIYPNITASNFSTPIVLAEGDVLTVSYKIEVA